MAVGVEHKPQYRFEGTGEDKVAGAEKGGVSSGQASLQFAQIQRATVAAEAHRTRAKAQCVRPEVPPPPIPDGEALDKG